MIIKLKNNIIVTIIKILKILSFLSTVSVEIESLNLQFLTKHII